MALEILPTEKCEVTKIVCPECRERVRGIGLLKESKIDGLVFRCRKCGKYKRVRAD